MSLKNKITGKVLSPSNRRMAKRWLSDTWNNIEWPFVGILALLSLFLGAQGYATYYNQPKTEWFRLDNLYYSLQLFVLESRVENINAQIPLHLKIAHILSPVIGAYTLFQAFLEIFENQIKLLKLLITRDHTIICGLGQKGFLLVRDQLHANQLVVIIERDSNNPSIEICHELGAIVLIGDARDPMILRKAGARRARFMFIVCGEDGTNVEIAERAQILVEDHRKNTLTCVLHITDNYLWVLLRQKMFSKQQSSSFRTELFNVYDTGARVLLQDTLFNNIAQPPHILVIGIGELANHLILRLAQNWCIEGNKDQLLISVVDPDVDRKLENLRAHYPLINKACRFFPHKYQTNWPEFQTGKFLEFSEEPTPVSHAYICFDDTTLGIQAGFVLLRLLQNQKAQIMVRMTEDAGLATFLKEIKNTTFENLSAFGLLDRTCGMGLFDDGTHEGLARAIHEDYLNRETQKGLTSQDNPNLVPWEALSEEIRESNRRQADHIGVKLAAVGCGMEPWREYGKENFPFDPKDILKMAQMEHQRWCEDRLRDGWKYGRERDDARKTHPDLIVWERLTNEAMQKDIAAAKLIPSLLARAGFQIYKL
jgi:hypothetical protein